MTEKRYATNVSILTGVSAAVALFFFVLVDHHRDVPDQVKKQRSALLSSGSRVAEPSKPAAQALAAAAQTRREPAKGAAGVPPPGLDGQQVYQAACVACHGAGVAGAPKLGDKDQWAKRIAKGVDALYASAVNGVQGSAGAMPPKGGNVTLSDVEVKAAVDYIVAQSK
jgi:cytochrome c5